MSAAPVLDDDRDPAGVRRRQTEVRAQLEVMSRAVEADRAAIALGVRAVRQGAAQRIDVGGQLLLAELLDAVERNASSGDVRRAAAVLAQHLVHRGVRP